MVRLFAMTILFRYIRAIIKYLQNLNNTLERKPLLILVIGIVISSFTAVLHFLLLLLRGFSIRFSIKFSILHICFFSYIYLMIFLMVVSMPVVDPIGERISSIIIRCVNKVWNAVKQHNRRD